MPSEMERKALNSDSDEHADPWRCTACGQLIYNTVWFNDRQYPVPGAPDAQFISEKFPRVCQVCFTLWEVVARQDYEKHCTAIIKRQNHAAAAAIDKFRRRHDPNQDGA